MKKFYIITLFLYSCASFLQDDGFRAQHLSNKCASISECEKLEVLARRRISICKDNSVGFVKCSDAKEDLQTILTWKNSIRLEVDNQ